MQKNYQRKEMKPAKNSYSEKRPIKDLNKKRRKSVRHDIYKLWQEELEEKGFNKLTRFQQGLL